MTIYRDPEVAEQVRDLTNAGVSSKMIARRLFISQSTVRRMQKREWEEGGFNERELFDDPTSEERDMALPKVDEKHECKQSEQLVGIIEEQRAEIERLSAAVRFHRADAEESKVLLKSAKASQEAQISR